MWHGTNWKPPTGVLGETRSRQATAEDGTSWTTLAGSPSSGNGLSESPDKNPQVRVEKDSVTVTFYT